MQRTTQTKSITLTLENEYPAVGNQVLSVTDGGRIITQVNQTIPLIEDDFTDNVLLLLNDKLSLLGLEIKKIDTSSLEEVLSGLEE